MFNKNKKAFTIIELLVVMAIIGILVLFGLPKFIGYVQKAQLVRIQHDVKVMQDRMETVLSEQNNEFNEWGDNSKDLGILIMKKQLYEHTGLTRKLDKSHIKFPKYNWVSIDDKLYTNLVGYEDMNKNLIAQNENLTDENTLSIGGPLLNELQEGYGYKVIPDKYKTEIKTRLKGTFYSHKQGKVYYEPNSPLLSIKPKIAPNCVAAETLGYVFEHETGTIVKYNGKEHYLIIPEAFLAKEQCWPVKIIGKGAFARNYPYPPIKMVILPPALEKIEEDAFKNNEIENIIIPPGVIEIGQGAFNDNPLRDVIIQGPSGSVNLGNNSFGPRFSEEGSGSNGNPEGSETSGDGGNILYKIPNSKDVGLIVNPNKDKDGNVIVNSDGKPTGTVSSSTSNWDSSGTNNNSGLEGKVIIIPDVIIVDGKEVEITEIAQGAFQGEGLIHVTLPSGLERIEDYAFAGNQLIGIDIPKKVNHIGNYAFAFNELYNGKSYKWTIGYINFKSEEQVDKVNKNLGNIEENGEKVKSLKESNLLDHIWINSNSKFIIPIKKTYVYKKYERIASYEIKKRNDFTTSFSRWDSSPGIPSFAKSYTFDPSTGKITWGNLYHSVSYQTSNFYLIGENSFSEYKLRNTWKRGNVMMGTFDGTAYAVIKTYNDNKPGNYIEDITTTIKDEYPENGPLDNYWYILQP